jgi:hypothetical protein
LRLGIVLNSVPIGAFSIAIRERVVKVVDVVNSLPRPLSKGTKKMNVTSGASNLMLFATRDVRVNAQSMML